MNLYTLNHLKKSVSDHSATFLATLFSMSVVLSCLSLILLARQNLVAMAERWGQDSEITAYLNDGLSDQEREKLQRSIQSIQGVDKAVYISKSESAKRFLKRMGHLSPDFIQSENPDDNPLPATFDVKVTADLALGDRAGVVEDIAEQITTYAGVTEVSFGQGWIDGWSRFLQKFNIITLAAIAFVLLLGLLIIGNATRVSMERRTEEIEVLELVGATSSWIRAPFLIEGALLGVLSAILSLGISNVLSKVVFGYFSNSGWMWISESGLDISLSSVMVILLLGIGFGLLGSFLCVRKINTGWLAGEPDEYS